MIRSIYQHFLSQSRQDYLASLKEAEKAEDFDHVVIEPVAEECPVCSHLLEVEDWINQQTIMRLPEFIVVHCTGTITDATATGIKNYWEKNLKWKNPGYHILIHLDGSVTIFAELDTICNGVAGYNSRSWHISTIGGVDNGKTTDTRSPQQIETQKRLLKALRRRAPKAKIKGHRDFPKVNKACPCFDAIPEFQNI
jgi:N-acetylmuramoyl-L-alanine amidase